MFKKLRAAIRIVGQQYPALTQVIGYDAQHKEYVVSSTDIALYGNVQNLHDGADISLGDDQATINHAIIFLSNDYINLGNPVYPPNTTTRVFLIYLKKYYRLTTIGDVQYGYHRYHGKLVNLLTDLPPIIEG